MKKIGLILLICMYTLSSFGVSVNRFYCCGKLKTTSISFIHAVIEKCSNEKLMAGCCKTTFKSLQVKDSHVAATGINKMAKAFTHVHLCYNDINSTPLTSSLINTAYSGNAPPLYHNLPIYILHCAYLI